MKYCYTFLIFVVVLSRWCFDVSAQNVTFNDANLAAKVRTALGLSSTDAITETKLATLTSLTATKAGISDLTGLEKATNLGELVVPNNNISDLSPLSKLTKLETLNLSNNLSPWRDEFNTVSDLSPLKNLTNLTSLQFINNQVSDISDLSKLTKLKELVFSNSYSSVLSKWTERNAVTDLSVLKKLTSLTTLTFNANNFRNEHGGPTDISPLSGLTSLKTLNMDRNSITSLDALKDLTNLTLLSVRYQSISNLNPLKKLTALQRLLLSSNKISDVSPLSGLTALQILWVSSNKISDVSPLSSLTMLTNLSLGKNPLDMRTLHALSGLTSFTNSLTSLSLNCTRGVPDFSVLSIFPNLRSLYLVGWKLDDISELSKFTDLTLLTLSDNNLNGDDINDIQALTALTELAMAGNKLRDISGLSKLTNLKNLYIPDNNISDISVLSGLPNLRNLDLYNNPVTDISPLVGLTSLRALYINVGVDTSALPSSVKVRYRPVGTVRCKDVISGGGGSFGGGGSRLSSVGQISIGELTFTSKDATDSLPQWIELYNTSETETVNLNGWRLKIEAHDERRGQRHAVITLKDLIIPPKQVSLIVTADAPNSVKLPTERIYHFFQHHPNVLQHNASDAEKHLLGENGFCLELSDPDGRVSDIIGNLDGDSRTVDAPAWELPSGLTDEGFRTSLLRQYDPQTDHPLDGRLPANYWRAADVDLDILTYWGKETDIGNPGYRDQGRPRFISSLVSISEMMLTSRGGLHSLPQWIELYNASETETVNLYGWQLKVEARDETGEHRSGVGTLGDVLIPPRQTALIVTSRGRRSRQISRTPVYHLRARDVFKHRRDQVENGVLGQEGFFLKLWDAGGTVRDIVGNLDGQAATADRPKWELPSGETEKGFRTSLIRRYFRAGDIPLDGKKPANWIRAADVALETLTYYGRQTDIGNPGTTDADRFPPGRVSISELMFPASGKFGALPQWIELYNASETETIDLRDWQLEIEGRDETGEHRSVVLTLRTLRLLPRQTALLVTALGSNPRVVGYDRLYDLSRHHRNAFRQPLPGGGKKVLGEVGFFLKLSDPNGGISDVVGNLDGDRFTTDDPVWKLPSGETGNGSRSSLMRRYHEVGMPLDGRLLVNWGRAVDMDLKISSYWGKATDVGNPGYVNDESLTVGRGVGF